MTDLDLEAIKRTWLNQCGPCDYGVPEYGCTHPEQDYRPVIMSLVLEIERLRAGASGTFETGDHNQPSPPDSAL